MSDTHGDQGFTRYKSRSVMSWTLANLPRLSEHPPVGHMGRPFAGRTVFVVGAGPSLAGNIDALREHVERGHPVVCVNAAGGPLKAAGITPDVMVIRESLDLTDQVEATDARLIAVEVGVHPDTWHAAFARLCWFVPGYPRQIEQYGYMLGEEPIFGGPAALCSAVALAERWGAARIVLVGCDLAYARDGSTYHPDAPRGTLRHEMTGEGDAARLRFTGDEQDAARCTRSGQQPPPRAIGYSEVLSHDWATWLPTINVYADQRTWLTTQAVRHGERIELLNATEGGSGVPGWRNVKLAEVPAPSNELAPLAFDMRPRIEPGRVKAVVAELARGAAVQEQASREMLSRSGPDLRVFATIPELIQGSPLAEALSAWALLDRPGGDPEAQIEYTYQAMLAAAVEAQRILGGR